MRNSFQCLRCVLLALGFLLLAESGPAVAETTVRVRFGEHADFQRMVFDWPAPVGYRVEQTDAGTLLIFEAPARLDLSAYERNAPTMIRNLTPGQVSDNAAARFEIPANAELKTAAWGNKVVVDVMKPVGALVWRAKPQPAPQAAQVPPAKKPAAAGAPAPAPTAEPKHEAPAKAVRQQPTQRKAEPATSQLSLEIENLAEKTVKTEKAVEIERVVETETEVRYIDKTPRFSIGPNANTLGPGLEAGYLVNNFVGLRLVGNYFPGEFNVEADDVRYNADLAWLSTGGILDLYPFGGGFRVSGGVRYNANTIELEARPRQNVVVGGQTFTPSEVGTIDGDIEYSRFAPYAGLGYEQRFLGGRLGLSFDLGVHYQGNAKVEAEASGTLANDPTFLAALDDESDELEDDLNILSWYPVVSLSVVFRF